VLLDDVGSYLQNHGIGTVGADIFLGQLPDQPDNCTALFEYGGSSPDLHWNGEYPGLQVRVRNKSYAAGRAKIGSIYLVLHGLCEIVLGTTRYLLVKANQSPESMGRDENGREEFVVNFSVIKEMN
jgi:hypothetical protein